MLLRQRKRTDFNISNFPSLIKVFLHYFVALFRLNLKFQIHRSHTCRSSIIATMKMFEEFSNYHIKYTQVKNNTSCTSVFYSKNTCFNIEGCAPDKSSVGGRHKRSYIYCTINAFTAFIRQLL